MLEDPQVVAVVVAHDRRELLAQALHALADQTAPPARVVVVDNASADGSAQVAEDVAAARGLPTRRTGPSVSVLRAEGLAPADVGANGPDVALRRRAAVLEDVFVVLTGEEVL